MSAWKSSSTVRHFNKRIHDSVHLSRIINYLVPSHCHTLITLVADAARNELATIDQLALTSAPAAHVPPVRTYELQPHFQPPSHGPLADTGATLLALPNALPQLQLAQGQLQAIPQNTKTCTGTLLPAARQPTLSMDPLPLPVAPSAPAAAPLYFLPRLTGRPPARPAGHPPTATSGPSEQGSRPPARNHQTPHHARQPPVRLLPTSALLPGCGKLPASRYPRRAHHRLPLPPTPPPGSPLPALSRPKLKAPGGIGKRPAGSGGPRATAPVSGQIRATPHRPPRSR